MKRITIAFLLLFPATITLSKAQNYLDIYDAMESYNRERDAGNEELAITYLITAKGYIDQMGNESANTVTSKYWKKKGDIYYTIASETSPRVLIEKETAPGTALAAYIKAIHVELNPKGKPKIDEKEDLVYKLHNTGVMFDKEATDKFNAKDLMGAYAQYERAFQAYKELADLAIEGEDKNAATTVTNMVTCAHYSNDCPALLKIDSLVFKYAQTVTNYSFLIECYYKNGDKPSAEALFAKAKKDFPDDYKVYLLEVNIAISENDYDKVSKVLQEAIAKFPDKRTEFILAEVNVHIAKGDNAKAIEALDIAIKNNAGKDELLAQLIFNSAVIYSQMGSTAIDSGKTEEGIGYVQKSIDAAKQFLAKDSTEMKMVNQLANNYIMVANVYDNQANAMDEVGPKYDELKAKAQVDFMNALKYLEKYYFTTKDSFAKNQLITLYRKVGQREKSDKLKAEP